MRKDGIKMIYIYDIQLNWFEKEIYDFFEWNEKDNFQQIRRIPLFKLEEDTFKDLYNNDVKVEEDFILMIKNKTELFDKNISKVGNCALFTNGIKAIAVKFSDDGENIFKSKLLLDEEDEIVVLSHKLGYTKLDYQVLNKIKKEKYLTRKESQIKKELQMLLEDSYKRKSKDEIKYIYYELFEEIIDDIDGMYTKIKNVIEKDINNKCLQLYNTLFINKEINI